ncbi:g8540 [Coccomyxa elongata]
MREDRSLEPSVNIVRSAHNAVDAIDDFVDNEKLSEIMDMQRSILKRFDFIKQQLDSFDKDTVQQVDDACKEISRNCELLVILKADLDSIYTKVRGMKRKLLARVQHETSHGQLQQPYQ